MTETIISDAKKAGPEAADRLVVKVIAESSLNGDVGLKFAPTGRRWRCDRMSLRDGTGDIQIPRVRRRPCSVELDR
jgi:hypothetical protein